MATYNGHQEDASGNILLSIGNGMTATLETGSTASQAYTKGAYVFFNNKLCKASTAISSGATLAIGTNLTQTSIGAELTSHLRATNGDEFYFDYKDGKAGYYPTASKTSSQFVPFGGTLFTSTRIGGKYTTKSTSTSTFTLERSISNYKYLLFTMYTVSEGTLTNVTQRNAINYNGTFLCTPDYFRSNGGVLYFAQSNTTNNYTLTYENDTSFKAKCSTSYERELYVYGLN